MKKIFLLVICIATTCATALVGGIAASQTRQLQLQGRESKPSYNAHKLEKEKLNLQRESQQLNKDKIDSTKKQIDSNINRSYGVFN